VKAAPFSYLRPDTVEEAVAMKAQHGPAARFLAGGQSLMPILNFRLDRPEYLIDINGLVELQGIEDAGDTIRIGAVTRHAEIARSDLVKTKLPLLAQCIPHIAHPAIRTRGTFGGSVALSDPAAEWPACCLALNARIVFRSVAGERVVEARDYFRGLYETARQPDELLTRIDIPAAAQGTKAVALELARRRGDFAIAGVLAQARMTDRKLDDLRIVFFGVGEHPIRIDDVERGIAAGETIEQVGAYVDAQIKPDDDIYQSGQTKTYLAKVLLGRAVDQLMQQDRA
jgi:carbon-monoxide dehydrogenase medium subunit